MALGLKYFNEDIKHFKGMIEADEIMIETVERTMERFPNSKDIQQLGTEQIERSQENIDYYQTKIHNLIEHGDEDG